MARKPKSCCWNCCVRYVRPRNEALSCPSFVPLTSIFHGNHPFSLVVRERRDFVVSSSLAIALNGTELVPRPVREPPYHSAAHGREHSYDWSHSADSIAKAASVRSCVSVSIAGTLRVSM
jgi:hypothetical protein